MAATAAHIVDDPRLPLESFDEGLSTLADGQNDGRVVRLTQYLNTSYSPDCDFVDGTLEERNLGEWEHATLQSELLYLFRSKAAEWKVAAKVELRLQVNATRFRVPDLMVLRAEQKVTRIVQEAPLLCVEILSPADSFQRMSSRLQDYLAMGVPHVWVFDPVAREAFRCDAEGYHRVHDELLIDGTPIRLALAEVFASLDEAG